MPKKPKREATLRDIAAQRQILKLERRIFHLEQTLAKNEARHQKEIAKVESKHAALQAEYDRLIKEPVLTPGWQKVFEDAGRSLVTEAQTPRPDSQKRLKELGWGEGGPPNTTATQP